MLGYLFLVLAIVILLPLVFFSLGRGRGLRPQGKDGYRGHIERKNPAADEPTPDVNTPRDQEGDSRVPPA
jgi:hypothetical protein